jgi:hypothetical protein
VGKANDRCGNSNIMKMRIGLLSANCHRVGYSAWRVFSLILMRP